MAYLAIRVKRLRSRSSASGPGLEMIVTPRTSKEVPRLLFGFFRLFLSFISLYCFALVVGPLASPHRSVDAPPGADGWGARPAASMPTQAPPLRLRGRGEPVSP